MSNQAGGTSPGEEVRTKPGSRHERVDATSSNAGTRRQPRHGGNFVEHKRVHD